MTDEEHGKRKRLVRHTACFTPLENALLMTSVNLAGVSISAFLRSSALGFALPRQDQRLSEHAAELLLSFVAIRRMSAEPTPRLASFIREGDAAIVLA